MQIDADARDVKELKADQRGRVNLGMEYRNETVEIVILDVVEDE